MDYEKSVRCILGDEGVGRSFKGFSLLRSGSFRHLDVKEQVYGTNIENKQEYSRNLKSFKEETEIP